MKEHHNVMKYQDVVVNAIDQKLHLSRRYAPLLDELTWEESKGSTQGVWGSP